MSTNRFIQYPRIKSRLSSFRPTIEALEDRCLLASFLVNSAADPGSGVCDAAECTLREAIVAANNSQGADDIQFNIGMGRAVSIALQDKLPPISESISIDGTSQPGFIAPGPPIVELDGAQVPGANAFLVNNVGTTIRGLVINRFAGSGIVLQGGGRHTIAGVYIGTNQGATTAPGNGGSGILLLDSNDNTIGGTATGDTNLIIGNAANGITIQAGMRNTIEGNFIGTNLDRRAGLGNAGAGIFIQNSSANQIGGSTPEQRNIIAFNGNTAVAVASGEQNRIIGNAIFSNGGLGIDLASNGPNFPQDPDPGTGANHSQNFPVLISATASASGTNILGTLNSAPGTSYTIDFYASDTADPTGFGEGDVFLGQVLVTTDPAGVAHIDVTLPTAAPPGSVITATATDPNGNTSEFSQAQPVTEPSFQFDTAAYSVGESDGVAKITVVRTNGSAGQFTVDISTSNGTANAGADYQTIKMTLTFTSGTTSLSIDVPILPDSLDETDETVNIELKMPSNGSSLGNPDTAVLAILDDDPAPSLSIDDPAVIEGDGGFTLMTFTVSLSAVSEKDVTVLVATADDTAHAPGDYTAIPPAAAMIVSIPARTRTRTVAIAVAGDRDDEPNETFFVNLFGATNALIADAQGRGTIIDDDSQLDFNVRAFVTAAVGGPAQLEIQYDIVGASAPQLSFAFFASTDARFDKADTEQRPRLIVTDPADLTIGSHTIRFNGAPYRSILNALDIPFVVTRGQILDAAGNVLAELEPTNNDISFVGLFHEPGMPLVIRGKDNTDRYVDDPADTVALAGGAVTTVTANFLAAPTAITSATISEIRALGLGGDDSIVAAANVAVPLIVRGGPGDDTVTGGSAADDLAGDAGNDALGGRLGNDSIDGGGGTDTADFGVEMHGVIANLATGRAKGQGRDTLRNLENMIGSPGRDRLTGSAADNILLGGPGADFIVGGAGRDALDGGDGDDSLFGEAGDDVLHGDAGNDLVCGSDGRDVITGGDGDDHLEGGNDDDEIRGGAGADFICGGAGNDLLFGNAGNDSMLGESGIDRLLGGSDFDSILFDASDLPVDLGGAGRDGGKAFRFGE